MVVLTLAFLCEVRKDATNLHFLVIDFVLLCADTGYITAACGCDINQRTHFNRSRKHNRSKETIRDMRGRCTGGSQLYANNVVGSRHIVCLWIEEIHRELMRVVHLSSS